MQSKILLFIIAGVFWCQADGRISCERIECISWDCCISANPLRTCFMDATTEMSEPLTNITSRRDFAVEGLWMQGNKKVNFLPHNTAKIFPNLLGLTAAQCSIKTIAYENFKKLYKLRMLLIGYNEIEEIESGTFEDLRSLQSLNLDGNKISSLDAGTFTNLKQLNKLFLLDNACINQKFVSNDDFRRLHEIISISCVEGDRSLPKPGGRIPENLKKTLLGQEEKDGDEWYNRDVI